MRPFRLRPLLTRPPWGGHRLAAAGKGEGSIGESWEVWRDNETASGQRLADLVDFPLLIKLLDTSERLSVQVHPDDARARAEGHASGKAEGWVILDAAPDAAIAYGLSRPTSPEALVARARSGAIEADLAWLHPRPGDVIDVPPGTIHAIGGGILLYEVQQPIDLTWRIYDWGRPRELHVEKAASVARLAPHAPSAARVRVAPNVERLLDTPWCVVEEVEGPAVREGWEAITAITPGVFVDGEPLPVLETVMLPPGVWALAGTGRVLAARPRSGALPR